MTFSQIVATSTTLIKNLNTSLKLNFTAGINVPNFHPFPNSVLIPLASKLVPPSSLKNISPYFIEYNVHNFTRINHCKFIHRRSHLKPFLSYLPCIVHREYFSIISHVKKCALYSIKYGNMTTNQSQ